MLKDATTKCIDPIINGGVVAQLPLDPRFSLPYPLSVEVKDYNEDFIPVQLTKYLGNGTWRGYDEDGETVDASWESIFPLE